MPGHTQCCTVTQNHLSKPAHLILQNATPLRKSAPWPPNISHEHVLCTAPTTENAFFADPLQMSHACHRFWKCYKTFTFCSLLKRCTIPCACHAKRHLNLQKWSEPLVFCTFSLRNVLCATTACTFSTSEPPKVVRGWSVLYIFTSKCASRHNGVHFFDIATSKSGPSMVCFVHFHFEMCFAPQRRALFWHRNFQKWSDHSVFCIVLYILTWKCAPRHNGVHFFDSPTSKSSPHVTRFEFVQSQICFAPQRRSIFHLSSGQMAPHPPLPTFRPSRATNHWKNKAFRDFPTLSHTWIFFWLLLFAGLLSSNLSLLSASALLCFSSVHIVGSLTSKLPSIIL